MWFGIVSFRKGLKGYPETTDGVEKVKKAIETILLTNKGERVMRPQFGAGIWQYVFEKSDDTASILSLVIEEALQVEPRIKIDKIETNAYDEKIELTIYFYLAREKELYSHKIIV